MQFSHNNEHQTILINALGSDALNSPETVVDALFIGTLQTLSPEGQGQQTGMYKHSIPNAKINDLGIIGDVQADKRVHGGIEKALHQYAQSSYATIISQYPELKDIAIAGSIGENITGPNMDDRNVYIGDIYQIGPVMVQVSQPRSPCWKINHRFNTPQLSKFIADNYITGWYYRVLQSGVIKVGDPISLLERLNDSLSIARFLEIVTSQRPSYEMLAQAAGCQGLNVDWKIRLEHRMSYLSKNTLLAINK